MRATSSAIAIPFRVLFLRSTREDYFAFTRNHLLFGLVCTWLVGMGRYWDNPRVEFAQHLGLGSVVYVFALASLLYCVGWGFQSDGWTYRRILTMVVLSSPPAAIYGLPVEKWFNFEEARTLNLWFLGVVALWRMLIWGRFVWIICPIGWLGRLSTILLPVVFIVTLLTMLNLEKAVFDIMGGLQGPPDGTTADSAYTALFSTSVLAVVFAFPVLLVTYSIARVRHAKRNSKSRSDAQPTNSH